MKLCTNATWNLQQPLKLKLLVRLLSSFFIFTWAHYIINIACHLSRTVISLIWGEKVCQWSRGQSTRDLWKYTVICGVLPLKQLCTMYKRHLQPTYGYQPTYITKCQIMDTYSMYNHQYRAIFMKTDYYLRPYWISCCYSAESYCKCQ